MGWISLARVSVAVSGLPRWLNGAAARMQFRRAAFAVQLASSAAGINSSRCWLEISNLGQSTLL
jgi:hypothetical protein